MAIRTAKELLNLLNDAMDRYEAGDATDKEISTITRLTDSMCKIVKTDIDVQRSKAIIKHYETPLLDGFSPDEVTGLE